MCGLDLTWLPAAGEWGVLGAPGSWVLIKKGAGESDPGRSSLSARTVWPVSCPTVLGGLRWRFWGLTVYALPRDLHFPQPRPYVSSPQVRSPLRCRAPAFAGETGARQEPRLGATTQGSSSGGDWW